MNKLCLCLLASALTLVTPSFATVMYPVNVKSSNVWIRVSKFSGVLRINGSIDDITKAFWSNIHLTAKPIVLPQIHAASAYINAVYANPKLGNNSTEFTGKFLTGDLAKRDIDQSVNAEAQGYFEALKVEVSRPANDSGDSHEIALKNFVHKGINKISFSVVAESSPWSLMVQVFTRENGADEVIQETYLDQGIGTASPVIQINIEDGPEPH